MYCFYDHQSFVDALQLLQIIFVLFVLFSLLYFLSVY